MTFTSGEEFRLRTLRDVLRRSELRLNSTRNYLKRTGPTILKDLEAQCDDLRRQIKGLEARRDG